MASLLDQLSPLEDEPDTRRTFEDLRGEVRIFTSITLRDLYSQR